MLAALDDDNRDAWALWMVLASRIAVDYGLGRTVFEKATEGMTLDDMADLLDRLAVLYDVLRPNTPPPSL